MKKFYSLLVKTLLFTTIAVNITGCKSDPFITLEDLKGGPLPGGGDNTMSFKVDGVQKTTTNVIGSKLIYPDPELPSNNIITGYLGSPEAISIWIAGKLEVKTYPITGESDVVMYYDPVNFDTDVSFFAHSGTVVITSLKGDQVSGTFSGTVTSFDETNRKKEITEGKFTAKLITVNAPNPEE